MVETDHEAALEQARSRFRAAALRAIECEIPKTDRRRHECNETFALQRFDEGSEIAAYLRREYGDRRLVVLDAGSGNGGVALGIAAAKTDVVIAMDIVLNDTLLASRRSSQLPVHQVLGAIERLPFRPGRFDVVLCLETIEHVSAAGQAAANMMQALRSAGQVMLTTPARWRYLFRRDPHYCLPLLLLLPDRCQRWVAERWLPQTTYDVHHIYWFAPSIIRLFPGRGRIETLVNVAWPPPPRHGAEWWQLVRHHVAKRLRHVLWDRIVVYKNPSPT